MKKFFLIVKLLLAGATTALAQSVGINNNGAQPNASAILDVSSTSKGLLIPRMTAAQRAAISTPATGLQVYQTDGTTGFYYYNGNAWALLGASGANLTGWATTGNTAIDPTTNFIGTTDAKPFIGKTNNEQVFRFDAVTNNTLIGYQSSQVDSTGGTYNHIIGYKTGFNNTGAFNHFDGLQAGYNNAGNNNQFIGYNTGYSNSSGFNNLFIGSAAGYSNTTGAGNYMLGYQAGYKNTSGGVNHFEGYQAGFNNLSGAANYFSGFQAGFSNATSSNNYFSGYKAGYSSKADLNHFEGNEAGTNNTTGTGNFFSGYDAGYYNITGSQNYFSGKQAGFSNISGSNNHFSGYEAGYSNLASENHFEGSKAGGSNTTGTGNLFIGFGAGYQNTVGSFNTYIGKYAGLGSINSDQNVFIGCEAGFSNNGNYNHFIGYRAGYSNTNGVYNHIDGYKAGALNTTGSYNNFVGNQAGYSNTTGGSNLASGFKAGFSNTTGSNNIFHGVGSGFKNTTGKDNTYIGQSAGHENISGSGNVALGNYAGFFETGNNKLYIANSSEANPLIYGEFDNQLLRTNAKMEITKIASNIDPVLQLKESHDDFVRLNFTNTAVIKPWIIAAKPATTDYNAVFNFNYGGNDVLSIHGTGYAFFYANLEAFSVYEYSDAHLKERIVPLQHSLNNLLKLNSYNYYWKDKRKDSTQQVGFLAQELEKTFPNLVHTNEKGVKSVSYTHMVPILVESIKEQQVMIDDLKTENANLKKDIAAIKAKLGLL